MPQTKRKANTGTNQPTKRSKKADLQNADQETDLFTSDEVKEMKKLYRRLLKDLGGNDDKSSPFVLPEDNEEFEKCFVQESENVCLYEENAGTVSQATNENMFKKHNSIFEKVIQGLPYKYEKNKVYTLSGCERTKDNDKAYMRLLAEIADTVINVGCNIYLTKKKFFRFRAKMKEERYKQSGMERGLQICIDLEKAMFTMEEAIKTALKQFSKSKWSGASKIQEKIVYNFEEDLHPNEDENEVEDEYQYYLCNLTHSELKKMKSSEIVEIIYKLFLNECKDMEDDELKKTVKEEFAELDCVVGAIDLNKMPRDTLIKLRWVNLKCNLFEKKQFTKKDIIEFYNGMLETKCDTTCDNTCKSICDSDFDSSDDEESDDSESDSDDSKSDSDDSEDDSEDSEDDSEEDN